MDKFSRGFGNKNLSTSESHFPLGSPNPPFSARQGAFWIGSYHVELEGGSWVDRFVKTRRVPMILLTLPLRKPTKNQGMGPFLPWDLSKKSTFPLCCTWLMNWKIRFWLLQAELEHWTTHTSSSTQVTLTSGKLYKTEVRGSLACAAEGVTVWGGQSWSLRSKCIISRRRVWIRILISWYRKKSEWL